MLRSDPRHPLPMARPRAALPARTPRPNAHTASRHPLFGILQPKFRPRARPRRAPSTRARRGSSSTPYSVPSNSRLYFNIWPNEPRSVLSVGQGPFGVNMAPNHFTSLTLPACLRFGCSSSLCPVSLLTRKPKYEGVVHGPPVGLTFGKKRGRRGHLPCSVLHSCARGV